MTMLRTKVWILGVVLACGAALPAQDGASNAERLDALLAELAKVGPEVWKQRLEAMQAGIAARNESAAKLRAEAKKLERRAAAEEAAAKELAAELEKVTKLRELLGAMQFRDAAGEAKAAAKPADGKEKAPEPKPEKKPEPKPGGSPKMAAESMATAARSEELLTWDDHLFDVFDANCTVCHDAGDASGGLDLSTYVAAKQGGGSGTTIVAGDPQASRLWLLVSHQEKPTMPPDEPRLEAEFLDKIRTWIAQGAPQDAAEAAKLAAERAAQRAKTAAEAERAAAGVGAQAAILPAFDSAVERAAVERGPVLRAIAVSPTAPLVAVPGPGQVLLLHADDLRELGIVAFPFGRPQVLGFSADGARLLAAGGEPGATGGAVVYDVAGGAELGRYGEQRDAVLAASLSADGTMVAVGGTRRRADVFAVADGAPLYRVEHDDWVTALCFAPMGDRLASADRAGAIRVVEASTGRGVHELRGHDGEVTALAWRADAALLASCGVDRTVRLWRDRDGRELWNKREHGDDALAVAWRGTDRLVSAGADRRLLHWKTDGNRDGDLPALPDWVYGVAVSADGGRALTADWAGGVGVVDLAERKLLARTAPFVATP